jgi:hypothetical protein
MGFPLFTRKNAFNMSKPTTSDYTPHPWLMNAVKEAPAWMPNPIRPRKMAFKDECLISLQDDTDPEFSPGDIIWFSFTLSFVIGPIWWTPEYRPMDFIRVGHLNKPEEHHSGLDLELANVKRMPLVTGAKFKLPSS